MGLAQAAQVAGLIVSIIGGGMSVYGIVCWISGYGDDTHDTSNQGIKFLTVGFAVSMLGGAVPSIITLPTGHVVAVLSHLRNMVIAVGGGLSALGVVHMLQGYGGESPDVKSKGLKQFKVGLGIVFIGVTIPAMLGTLATLTGSVGDTVAAFTILAEGFGNLIFLAGAGIGAWGAVNLIEGYGGDSPEAKSQGIKQLIAGFVLAITSATIAPEVIQPIATMMVGGGNPSPFIFQTMTGIGNIVTAIGAGLSIWGIVNLIGGYGSDSPAEKAQGGKQFFIGVALIPLGILLPAPMTTIATTSPDAITPLITGIAGIIGSAVASLGAIIATLGFLNLFGSYGSDSGESKAQGIKQFMMAAGFILAGTNMPGHIENLIQGGGNPVAIIQELSEIVGWAVVVVGVGVGLWGLISLMEAYGDDDTQASKSQGIKQFMAGGGLILFGIFAVPTFGVVLTTM